MERISTQTEGTHGTPVDLSKYWRVRPPEEYTIIIRSMNKGAESIREFQREIDEIENANLMYRNAAYGL